MRPRADARLLVLLVMQRHMFCGRSVVLQCVSHGLAAPVSSRHPPAPTLDHSFSIAAEARSEQAIEEGLQSLAGVGVGHLHDYWS